ncbi:MAG: metalloprotease, partial [Acidimicrobiales bacterium]
MGMSAQGRGLRLNLFSVPVTFDPLMLAFVAFISLSAGDRVATLVGLIALFFSVLVHEFGHAIAFARLGMRPSIRLHLFGGVTYAEGGLEWKQRIGVSLAGPAAGFALGFTVLGLQFGGMTPEYGLGGVAVSMLIFANLIWGFVNLLPMLPLDGGHVVEAVLVHKNGERGWIATRYISIAAYFAFLSWRELGARSENRVNVLLGAARAAQRRSDHLAVIELTSEALTFKHSQDQARWLRAVRTASLLELGLADRAFTELNGLSRSTRGFWAWAAVQQEVATPEEARHALLEVLRSGEPMWP